MLETKALTVAYGTNTVLQDISLEVTSGEILALIGTNGAGKTTLVRAVSGTVPIAAGKVCVAGQDLSALTTIQRARSLAHFEDSQEG